MVENQQWYEQGGYVTTHRADQQGFSRVFYEKTLAEQSAFRAQRTCVVSLWNRFEAR
jgi:hypothetical protein